MLPTAGNGQPGFATYRRDRDGVHRAHSIQILTVTAAGIARVVSFQDAALFPAFGRPLVAPAAARTGQFRIARQTRR